jgi:DNA (cytosine-5)-methyltransferase 1
MSDPLKTLNTHETKALAVPVEGRDGKSAQQLDIPLRTQTTRLETALVRQPDWGDAGGPDWRALEAVGLGMPFISELYGTSTGRPVTEPAGTFTSGGNHHALVQSYYGNTHEARPVTDALGTLTTVDRYALIHRMNSGGAEMTTPVHEELRTLTTTGHQALLQQPEERHITPADLKAAEEMVPEVLFRMFRPHEVAAGMAFPADYVWQPVDRLKPISNRDLVKATGNAVTPPSARDIIGVAVESLGVAA